jgi:hypothetical protein
MASDHEQVRDTENDDDDHQNVIGNAYGRTANESGAYTYHANHHDA